MLLSECGSLQAVELTSFGLETCPILHHMNLSLGKFVTNLAAAQTFPKVETNKGSPRVGPLSFPVLKVQRQTASGQLFTCLNIIIKGLFTKFFSLRNEIHSHYFLFMCISAWGCE